MTSNSMTTTKSLAVDITESHAALTYGLDLIVDARRLKGVRTIFGAVGIPVTGLARITPPINIQYVQFVGEILNDSHYSLAWDTRFVAAFNVITTDAQIAIYNAKYKYAFWRPVTAIQVGSPGVTSDASWTPLFATPRSPEYPSSHRAKPTQAHFQVDD
jgi:hypothetical protein